MDDPPSPLRLAVHKAVVTAHVLRNLGAHTTGLIVANSARRRWYGARSRATRPAAGVSPGRLVRVEAWNPRPGTAQFHFERARLEVAFLASDVVRVTWGPGPLPVPYAVTDEPPWSVPDVQAHPLDALRDDGPWVLRSDALEVAVAPDGAVRTARPGGPPLRSESAPVRRGLAWEQDFVLRAGERLSGLGEQAGGVDLRGGTYRLWNTDVGGSWGPGRSPLYVGIPVLVATHGDGDVLVFYENSTDALFRLGEAGDDPDREAVGSVSFAGGVLRRYLVAGSPPELLDRYSELTGRPALPPRWALGYHQSRWGYRDEADVRTVVDGFTRMGVPLSAVHLDIDYMRGFRVFTVDEDRFPDLPRLTGDMAGTGVRLVTIMDVGVKVDPDYDVYTQGLEQHLFCTDPGGHVVEGVVWPGRAVFPDFTDPAARRWWGGRYRALSDAGVAGFWHDMNEPTSISLLGDPTLPTTTRHHFDGRGGDHGEGHNLYGTLMNRAGHEGLRAAAADRRPFVVSRSGWAGNQRYGWIWTGDAASTWESMRQQVATVIGLGLSGIPCSGSDTGGFSGNPGDELYLRWLQMSVCMGYCRTHSVLGAPRREPWAFAPPTGAVVASWIRFRYRLLPYLYTLAHVAADSGAPLVRPLWWPPPGGSGEDRPGEAAGDERGADGDDAFKLGDDLLVAVIASPGARRRRLPPVPGSWTSVWDGTEPGDGGTVEAPLERTPVLARQGAVIPLDDGWAEPLGPCRLDADHPSPVLPGATTLPAGGPGGAPTPGAAPGLALDHAPLVLSFHCWVDAEGRAEGMCIDDGGDGNSPRRRDRVQVTGALPGGEARVTWERTGDHPPPPVARVVLHGVVGERALADGTAVPVSGGTIECPAFSELTVQGLRRAPGRGR